MRISDWSSDVCSSDLDMLRPPGIVVIAPGIGAGLDGDEAVAALVVGDGAAIAGEIRIERRVVLVDGVAVTAGRIGLPQFDQRARHRPDVFVEHTPASAHALPVTARKSVAMGKSVSLCRTFVV